MVYMSNRKKILFTNSEQLLNFLSSLPLGDWFLFRDETNLENRKGSLYLVKKLSKHNSSKEN